MMAVICGIFPFKIGKIYPSCIGGETDAHNNYAF